MHSKFFTILKKDHDKVDEILQQLKATTEKQPKKRESLLAKLQEEWIPHMRGEEKLFFPLLKEHLQSRDKSMEAVEEHHVAEMVFSELNSMPKDDEKWGAKLSVMQELIEHHVEEEEGEIFELAREVLDDIQLGEVLKAFEKEKEDTKKKIG